MDNDQIIQKIRDAKRSHVSWVMKADALIHGIPLEKNQVPLDGTECAFGHWYYGEGQNLSHLISFKELEKPHFDLHSSYAEIFKLLFGETRQSLLSKLFGSSKKINEVNVELARKLFSELKKHSDIVIEKLEMLEKEFLAKQETSAAKLHAVS